MRKSKYVISAFSCLTLLIAITVAIQPITATDNYGFYRVYEGEYVLIYIHSSVDNWVKENSEEVFKLIDDVVGKILSTLELKEYSRKVNITIISLTLGEKLGIRREPFLITDSGVILGFAPYEVRGAQPFLVENEDIVNMGYLLGWVVDSVTIYLLINNIGYWHNDAAFGLMEALISYFMSNTIPLKYSIASKLLKYPHGFTASMINLGYYKPLKEAIIHYRAEARSYAWEVDSFSFWIIKKYGVEKFITTYKLIAENPIPQVFKDVYGVSLEELERDWLAFLKKSYGNETFTKTTVVVLASRNPLIIYDDSYKQLKNVAEDIKYILEGFAYRFFEIEADIRVVPFSQVKDSIDNVLRENNVLAVTYSKSTAFYNTVRYSKCRYIDICNNGFSFVRECHTSNSDTVFVIDETHYDTILGIIVGNNVTLITNKASLLVKIHPFSIGGCYIKGKLYVVFPHVIPLAKKKPSVMVRGEILVPILTLLAVLLLYIALRKHVAKSK